MLQKVLSPQAVRGLTLFIWPTPERCDDVCLVRSEKHGYRARLALAASGTQAQVRPAQIIQGRIIEDRTATPIEGASVSLVARSGRMLDRIQITNKHGVFIMAVEQGQYKLRIKRIGYDSVDTQIIDVQPNQNVMVNYSLSPRVAKLAKMVIQKRSGLERGREGMAKREPEGKGVFLYEPDIREIANLPLYEILGRVEGLQTVADGSIRTTRGWGCLQYLVNRLPVMEVPDAKLDVFSQLATLYQMIPNGIDIAGVEIYRQFSEVPKEFRFDAWPDAPNLPGVTPPRYIGELKLRSNQILECGLINIWTKAAW